MSRPRLFSQRKCVLKMAISQDKYRLIFFKDNKAALWISFFFLIYVSETVISFIRADITSMIELRSRNHEFTEATFPVPCPATALCGRAPSDSASTAHCSGEEGV